MSIVNYSTIANNNTAISGINIAENCPPSGINDAIRQAMADAKEWQNQITPVTTSAGLPNAQTLTLVQPLAAYAPGLRLAFLAGVSNTGAASLNISNLGAIPLTLMDGTALPAGALAVNSYAEVIYDGSAFRLIASPGILQKSAAPAGYQFIGPILLQWNSTLVSLDTTGTGALAFPIPFPTAMASLVLTNGDSSQGASDIWSVKQSSLTLSSFAFVANPNPGAVNRRVNFLAIGY